MATITRQSDFEEEIAKSLNKGQEIDDLLMEYLWHESVEDVEASGEELSDAEDEFDPTKAYLTVSCAILLLHASKTVR